MGQVCSNLQVLPQEDLPNLSTRLYLYQKQIVKEKLCTFSWISSRSNTQTSVINPYQDNNLIHLSYQFQNQNHRFSQLEFKLALDQSFQEINKKLISKQIQFKDTILFKEPAIKSNRLRKQIFKLIIEKIDSLQGELTNRDLSLRIELPWSKILNKDKIRIIKEIKNNRIRCTMNSKADDPQQFPESGPIQSSIENQSVGIVEEQHK